MKRIFIITLTIFLIALSLALVVSAENSPSGEPSIEGNLAMIHDAETTAGQDYANNTGFLDGAHAFISQYWDKFVVGFYVIYHIFPKIGSIAKSKKDRANLKNTLNSFFGKDGSVLKLQNALAETQTKFMNDASAVFANIEKAALYVKDIAEHYESAMTQREEMKNLVLACQGAVSLMASQLNDLVLNSPSITAKKKAEIDAAWCEKSAEINTLVQKVVSHDEQSEDSVA